MCGINGVFNLNGAAVEASKVLDATRIQRHRGPDDEGFLFLNTRTGEARPCRGEESDPRLDLSDIADLKGGKYDLAFGFRRLSIQDLSISGHQPMATADQRCWIVFNGEIYNYIELRSELASLGHVFRTGSDTEVILAAYVQWGVACLPRLNGMWAFAIWDSKDKTLFCARDRFGEKPFHYVFLPGKVFAFASEIKALWSAGVVERRINDEMFALYKDHDQVDVGEQSFFDNVMRLPQGHYLLLRQNGSLEKQRYWDIDLAQQEEAKSDAWYAEEFRNLFFESVRLRLRADVPVGVQSVGGIRLKHRSNGDG